MNKVFTSYRFWDRLTENNTPKQMQKSATHAAHTAEVSLAVAHDVDQVILQHSVERLLQRLNERPKEHVYTTLECLQAFAALRQESASHSSTQQSTRLVPLFDSFEFFRAEVRGDNGSMSGTAEALENSCRLLRLSRSPWHSSLSLSGCSASTELFMLSPFSESRNMVPAQR